MRTRALIVIAIVGLGVASFAAAAGAQTPSAPSCSTREVTLYFEKDGTAVNPASRALVEKLAADAKACGANDVVIDAPAGPLELRRASAIASAFRQQGVNASMVRPASLEPQPVIETVLDRAARVRISVANGRVT